MKRATKESPSNPSHIGWTIGGAALGAVAMYLSDPDRGRRRRALATDKIYSLAYRTSGALDVASRDLGNRLQGLRARTSRRIFRREEMTDDEILIARVRQKLGHAVAHPHAVHVTAHNGYVTLHGSILASEKPQLMQAVRRVHGIRDIEDRLQIHERPDHIPSLQGSGKMRNVAMQQTWPPGMQAVAVAGGAALGAIGLARRSPLRAFLAAAGLGLLARGMSNKPLAQIVRGSAGRQAIRAMGPQAVELEKSIYIQAVPEQVFDLWSRYENFPRFMSNVREVRELGDGRSHWVVSGPAGMQVEWDARTTRSRRPELLSWESEANATVRNNGSVRFEREGSGTRVTVRLSYSPPGGGIGHAIASLFDGDPKRQMDEDLMRMKDFIESGNALHDAAKPIPSMQSIQQAPGTLH